MSKKSSKRKKTVTYQKTKDSLRIEIPIKRKLKPRGRSFKKGNKIGHRFKKGEVSNPLGRKPQILAGDAARAKLAELIPDHPDGKTVVEGIMDVLETRSLAGDVRCIEVLIDRAEGRPRQAMEVISREDPLADVIKSIRQRSEEIGPPPEDDEE